MGEFPSGQRGQTVNLLSMTSVVRIHLPPPKSALFSADFWFIRTFWRRTEAADAACFCTGRLDFSSFHAAVVRTVRSRQLGLMSSTQRHWRQPWRQRRWDETCLVGQNEMKTRIPATFFRQPGVYYCGFQRSSIFGMTFPTVLAASCCIRLVECV